MIPLTDRIWHGVYVQCPDCNGGITILRSCLEYKKEDKEKFGITFWNQPRFKMKAALCKCGKRLSGEEIEARIKGGYTMPSTIWVCPNCSTYHETSSIMTDMNERNEEGEEWQEDVNKRMRITSFESGDLICKNCHNEYRESCILLEDDSVIHVLSEK